MSHKDKIMIAMQVIAPADAVEEGERLFASHAEFMEETHHREGELAMLSYNIASSPEYENPLAPKLVPTGNRIFLMVEVYETEQGVADHWRLGQQVWQDFPAMAEWMQRCQVTILHGSKIVHSLW
jgi:hypothetical protein